MKTTTLAGFEIANLTPHAINIVDAENNSKMIFPPSGVIARIETSSHCQTTLDNKVPIYTTVYGDVEGLPLDDHSPTLFIVSNMVKNALPDDSRLIAPSQLVRNDKGEVIGCKGLEF